MPHEVAITSSGDSRDGTTYVWDIRTGTVQATFKQSGFHSHTLTTLRAPHHPLSCSGFLGVTLERPMVHCFTWNRDQAFLKFPCPERLAVLELSYSGRWAVAGTPSGRLYVWETSTGQLVRSWDAHYRAVTALRFARDDSFLVSGSEDAVVSVWELAEMLEPVGYATTGPARGSRSGDATGTTEATPTPLYTWAEHTLPITNIVCGYGLGPATRTITVSRDRTCKVWDHSTGELLTTLLLPAAITAVTLDSVEARLYLGTDTGVIWRVELYERARMAVPSTDAFAMATAEVPTGDWVAVGGEQQIVDVGSRVNRDDRTSWPTFNGHTTAVTGLQLSLDGTLLVSSDQAGRCVVWDTASREQLRTFDQHRGPVSNLIVALRPPELSELSMLDAAAKRLPAIQPFKRLVTDPTAATANSNTGAPTLDPAQFLTGHERELEHILADVYGADGDHFGREDLYTARLEGLDALNTDDGSGQKAAKDDQEDKVAQLQAELAKVQSHYARLRRLNEDLYNMTVDQVLGDGES
ncbi:Pre-rRNA-processing protein ipi3 [Tieghemiomyces parasiticus]|uniref:Pre-rRNA-processing protein ipi3 n=1 Tax=Tieghemiomyces parasiticus TaxID=78921 RepID=A0A9W8AFK2_9FUNG|nr:Pre-rRNA-processing protein ipi3 [Tieghemiomyces parasiticus]